MGCILITRLTLLEALRRRLFLAVLLGSIVLVAVFAILLNIVMHASLNAHGGVDPQVFELGEGAIITVLAIWMVYLLSSTLTIVFSANLISGEVEAGTFAIIVPKPLTRVEIVVGKWFGSALMVCAYTALLFFAFLAVIQWQTGYWPTDALPALGLLELSVLVLLGITTLGSALVPTMVNGAIALVLFLGAPLVSMLQYVVQLFNAPSEPSVQTAVQPMTTMMSLVIPTDALWHGASFYLLPPASDLLTLGGISMPSLNTPFTSGQPVAPALLIWAALYCLAFPALAALRFHRRDL
jgi:ABC-type transport system involved in multi-copper enzyme maturation permease subunit